MKNKPSILFINLAQYGMHTDTYKYCKYLNNRYNITYLCIDKINKKIEDETNVIYLKNLNSSIKNTFNIIKYARKLINKNSYNIIHITYFKLSSLVKIYNNRSSYILDIRTGAVDKSKLKRLIHNYTLKNETFFFNNITIISESLRKALNINKNKSTIIPLGADKISVENKTYTELKLFYIGSFEGRDIHKTINGLALYIKKENTRNITYDIFGFGKQKDIDVILESIKTNNLQDIVKFHGRKEHHEIKEYFQNCNVGISFIPKTDYYDCQPPTKTFEYINSGMICIATDTSENKNIINNKNGILCNDNDEDFMKALIKLKTSATFFKTNTIINSLNEYTWDNIIENKLYPLIERERIE